MKIAITGATGLIGRHLSASLLSLGHDIWAFSRDPEKSGTLLPGAKRLIKYRPYESAEIAKELEGADALIHLAGQSVSKKRWDKKGKEEIYRSRVKTTGAIVEAMGMMKKAPMVFICASAIGYYGPKREGELTEESRAGEGFLSELSSAWEEEATKAQSLGIRTISLRTGLVLANDGGILSRMIPIYKLCLGGPLGNGKQYFPWIHIQDVCSIIIEALDNQKITGPLNLVSPGILRDREFSGALAKALRRPKMPRIPLTALRLLFGDQAYYMTGNPLIIPRKALDAGYVFKFPDVSDALNDLLK